MRVHFNERTENWEIRDKDNNWIAGPFMIPKYAEHWLESAKWIEDQDLEETEKK